MGLKLNEVIVTVFLLVIYCFVCYERNTWEKINKKNHCFSLYILLTNIGWLQRITI